MNRSKFPAFVIAAVMLLAGGWVLALVVDPAWVVGLQRTSGADDAGHEDHDDPHEGHVHLTEQAYKNLKLRIRPVTLSSGLHTIQVPGEIVEKPGHSDYALAAPINGIVQDVYVLPGQAIRPGQPLFKLQVIDESLATAQLNLLNTIARLATVTSELKRVGPLADAGTVLGRKKLELEYEQNELQLKQHLYEQELEVRGLTGEQVASIKTNKKLIRELVVRMPASVAPKIESDDAEPPLNPAEGSDPAVRPVSTPTGGEDAAGDWQYTIEELRAFPGKSVQRGDDLCHIAYHTELFIRGQVFENEWEYIVSLGQGEKADWTLTAVFGSHDDADVVEGFTVHNADNHVQAESQTFVFYVALQNEVVRQYVDEDGRRFRTWRYKPGQRVHLKLPIGSYTQKIRLNPDAVAIEGASAYVFREVTPDQEDHGHAHTAAAEDNHGHSHGGGNEDAPFKDLERVPVAIDFQNSDYLLIDPDGLLKPGDRIATSNAYQLYLEQKTQSGGGDAGHGHEH